MKAGIVPRQLQKVCSVITAGVGPAVVALVVLGWRVGSGRIAVMVLIAVRSGMSCRLGAAGAGAAGSAFHFISFFIFNYLSRVIHSVCV